MQRRRMQEKLVSRIKKALIPAVTMFMLSAGLTLSLVGSSRTPNLATFPDPTGLLQTLSTTGGFDISNPFFQSLGTNGRSCVSCHQPSDAWSVTPPHIQTRFEVSGGLDPIFRTVDGANCPSADVSTVHARKAAYSMLLKKGLIRVSLPVPDNADFEVTAVADPHGCPETTASQLAMFRRPPPATNVSFLTTVMWDGRESLAGKSLNDDLKHQAMDATLGHAQGAQPPTDAQLQSIADFQMASFTAQVRDNRAGDLNDDGAKGGPLPLSQQEFYVGINDVLGADPTGAAFNPVVFTLYEKWTKLRGSHDDDNDRSEARASVARGEALFNTLPITISGVAGLNDKPGVPASFIGNCTSCHDAPNVGNHSVALAINIGVTDFPAVPALDTKGLPVYTIQCNAGGKPIQTTDPARALITGKCADIGKTKGPILRALAARAPYFHNGSAATLDDVVDFYVQRFGLTLSRQQKKDLVAFLGTL
ncbi:MAG TPA: hypothetical protein VF840_12205 [Terriglobales bacterium]